MQIQGLVKCGVRGRRILRFALDTIPFFADNTIQYYSQVMQLPNEGFFLRTA
jgi:hypothetical protein